MHKLYYKVWITKIILSYGSTDGRTVQRVEYFAKHVFLMNLVNKEMG